MVQKIPAETETTPLAILFTNADGRVVFANRNFLRLTKNASSKVVAGKRLEAILTIEPQIASKILSLIFYNGFIDRLPMSIFTATETVPILFTGVAAYDAKRNYIGADIFLHEQVIPAPQSDLHSPPQKHTGIIKLYVDEVFSGTRAKGNSYIQAYVISQIETLQVLLARMGGLEVRNALERAVNEIALKNAIPANMQNGYLEFAQKSMDISVYHIILRAALEYATNVIGYHIVGQELDKIDSNLDAGLLQLLTQIDLRPTSRLGA